MHNTTDRQIDIYYANSPSYCMIVQLANRKTANHIITNILLQLLNLRTLRHLGITAHIKLISKKKQPQLHISSATCTRESPPVSWLQCGMAAMPATGACSRWDNTSAEPRPQPSCAANKAQSLEIAQQHFTTLHQALYNNDNTFCLTGQLFWSYSQLARIRKNDLLLNVGVGLFSF